MAELGDALDLGSSPDPRDEGSSPSSRTTDFFMLDEEFAFENCGDGNRIMEASGRS